MKDFFTILSENGIVIPDDKREALKQAVFANYKSINEYNNVVSKRDEYKMSLDDVTTKLNDAQKNSEDAENLRKQIEQLTGDLTNEKNARAADAKRSTRSATINNVLKSVKFVNEITEKSIHDQILAELEKEDGRDAATIWETLKKDKDGNDRTDLFEQQKPGAVVFTAPKKDDGKARKGIDVLRSMTLDERTAFKRENPDLYNAYRRDR